MLFPEAAIAILRQASWAADAERTFELLSGGFIWSDERLDDVAHICIEAGSWAFRYVIAYRASLICGAPRSELAEPWNQLRIACPDWPGFRPERNAPSLKEELEAENEALIRQLDHVSDICERADRIAATREKRMKKRWRLW